MMEQKSNYMWQDSERGHEAAGREDENSWASDAEIPEPRRFRDKHALLKPRKGKEKDAQEEQEEEKEERRHMRRLSTSPLAAHLGLRRGCPALLWKHGAFPVTL